MENKIKNLLHKIKINSLLIIYICCLIIGVFWTYLLFQVEIKNNLYLAYSNIIDSNSLIFSILTVIIFWVIKKFKEFKQELFDKIEREHRNTISYLQSNLTEQINYSTKAILLQEKLKK